MFSAVTIPFVKKNYPIIILCLLVGLYMANGIFYLRHQSITFDEGPYFNYAKRYLHGHPAKEGNMVDDSKMPVIALNTLPRVAEQVIYPKLKKSDLGVTDIMRGRYVTLFVSLFTILLVYKWAKLLYGTKAGLYAAFLMAFCPNNLACAGLVTEDSYAVLALLTVMYCTYKFCTVGSKKYFVLLCCSVALAQLVKQTLLHLYVLVPLCIIIFYWANKPAVNIKKKALYIIGFILINWLIINTGYYFYQTNTAMGSYHFISRPFKWLQHLLPPWLPVPLPKPFVDGIDMVKYNNDLGGGGPNSTFGKVNILGHATTGGSFWYYYLVSVVFKTPISYLAFVIWGLLFKVKYHQIKYWSAKGLFLLMPVVYFFIALSLFIKIQSGMRHIIFVYPFLFIMSARIIPNIKTRFSKIMVAALCMFLATSVLLYWGNYYPYTNELVADKKMAYWYVGSDNLEYRQAAYFFNDYLAKHPKVKFAPQQPEEGIFLITTNDYLDIWNLHQYNWIARFKPSGQVAYNGLLITVTAKDLQR